MMTVAMVQAGQVLRLYLKSFMSVILERIYELLGTTDDSFAISGTNIRSV
jgi:hypothetical protein